MNDNEQTEVSEESADAPEVQSTPDIAPEVVAEAKRQGWVDKEHYDGPEGKWVPADKFVEKGKEINAILRKNNERLTSEIAEIKQTMQEFKAFTQTQAKAAFDKQIAELREEKAAAIDAGEGRKVLAIDDQIDELKAQRKEAPATVTAKSDPVFDEWVSENKWYTNDKELNEEATAVGHAIRMRNPDLKGRDFLDEVGKRVKKLFPEKFENKREQANMVSGTSNGRTQGGKSLWNDLPASAKAAGEKFVKQGLFASKEEYAKEWHGG